MKLGVFGGTFDPVHTGHLILAQEVCERLHLDKVLFVPAAQPPHKPGKLITSSEQRLAMLHRAVESNPLFEVDALELNRPGPSFTVDTLLQLKQRGTLFLLMGQDSFISIETWHEYRKIIDLAKIVVATRPGSKSIDWWKFSDPILRRIWPDETIHMRNPESNGDRDAHLSEWKVCTIEIPGLNISASEIRRRVAHQWSIRYLVVDSVRDYIDKNHLYLQHPCQGE